MACSIWESQAENKRFRDEVKGIIGDKTENPMDHEAVERQKRAVSERPLTVEEVMAMIAREVDPLRARMAAVEAAKASTQQPRPIHGYAED